jgi:hypothetical protein
MRIRILPEVADPTGFGSGSGFTIYNACSLYRQQEQDPKLVDLFSPEFCLRIGDTFVQRLKADRAVLTSGTPRSGVFIFFLEQYHGGSCRERSPLVARSYARRPGFDSRSGHVSPGTSSLGWR